MLSTVIDFQSILVFMEVKLKNKFWIQTSRIEDEDRATAGGRNHNNIPHSWYFKPII